MAKRLIIALGQLLFFVALVASFEKMLRIKAIRRSIVAPGSKGTSTLIGGLGTVTRGQRQAPRPYSERDLYYNRPLEVIVHTSDQPLITTTDKLSTAWIEQYYQRADERNFTAAPQVESKVNSDPPASRQNEDNSGFVQPQNNDFNAQQPVPVTQPHPSPEPTQPPFAPKGEVQLVNSDRYNGSALYRFQQRLFNLDHHAHREKNIPHHPINLYKNNVLYKAEPLDTEVDQQFEPPVNHQPEGHQHKQMQPHVQEVIRRPQEPKTYQPIQSYAQREIQPQEHQPPQRNIDQQEHHHHPQAFDQNQQYQPQVQQTYEPGVPQPEQRYQPRELNEPQAYQQPQTNVSHHVQHHQPQEINSYQQNQPQAQQYPQHQPTVYHHHQQQQHHHHHHHHHQTQPHQQHPQHQPNVQHHHQHPEPQAFNSYQQNQPQADQQDPQEQPKVHHRPNELVPNQHNQQHLQPQTNVSHHVQHYQPQEFNSYQQNQPHAHQQYPQLQPSVHHRRPNELIPTQQNQPQTHQEHPQTQNNVSFSEQHHHPQDLNSKQQNPPQAQQNSQQAEHQQTQETNAQNLNQPQAHRTESQIHPIVIPEVRPRQTYYVNPQTGQVLARQYEQQSTVPNVANQAGGHQNSDNTYPQVEERQYNIPLGQRQPFASVTSFNHELQTTTSPGLYNSSLETTTSTPNPSAGITQPPLLDSPGNILPTARTLQNSPQPRISNSNHEEPTAVQNAQPLVSPAPDVNPISTNINSSPANRGPPYSVVKQNSAYTDSAPVTYKTPSTSTFWPGQVLLTRIPRTKFTCRGRKQGYYADVETDCQVFHVCQHAGLKSSFLCPAGSVFNQRLLVCDWWFDTICETEPPTTPTPRTTTTTTTTTTAPPPVDPKLKSWGDSTVDISSNDLSLGETTYQRRPGGLLANNGTFFAGILDTPSPTEINTHLLSNSDFTGVNYPFDKDTPENPIRILFGLPSEHPTNDLREISKTTPTPNREELQTNMRLLLNMAYIVSQASQSNFDEFLASPPPTVAPPVDQFSATYGSNGISATDYRKNSRPFSASRQLHESSVSQVPQKSSHIEPDISYTTTVRPIMNTVSPPLKWNVSYPTVPDAPQKEEQVLQPTINSNDRRIDDITKPYSQSSTEKPIVNEWPIPTGITSTISPDHTTGLNNDDFPISWSDARIVGPLETTLLPPFFSSENDPETREFPSGYAVTPSYASISTNKPYLPTENVDDTTDSTHNHFSSTTTEIKTEESTPRVALRKDDSPEILLAHVQAVKGSWNDLIPGQTELPNKVTNAEGVSKSDNTARTSQVVNVAETEKTTYSEPTTSQPLSEHKRNDVKTVNRPRGFRGSGKSVPYGTRIRSLRRRVDRP